MASLHYQFLFLCFQMAPAMGLDVRSDDDKPLRGDPTLRKNAHIAHGVLMSIAVVLIFPIGAVMIRLFSFPSLVKWHAVLQSVGLLVLIIGYGMGAWLGYLMNEVYTKPHEFLGTALVALFLLQPLFGRLHHRHFVRTGVKNWKGKVHVWFGRILIAISLANGGSGLALAGMNKSGKIVYAIIVAITVVVYGATLIRYYMNRRKKPVPEEREGQEERVGRQEGLEMK